MLENNSITSIIFGILSIIFYSVVYYPQFYVIYKTKKTDGISIWMLLVWGQADFMSLIGTVILNLELSLIIIGWYHVVVGILMTLYTLYYDDEDSNENKLVKYVSVIIYYIINVCVCIYLTSTMLYNYEAGSTIGWMSSIFYIIGRVPQFYLNYNRKTTEGLSILMYIFTILGNTCYLLATITYSIEYEYILTNMPWIIMIVVTVIMDFVVIFQSYYYKNKKNQHNYNKDIENILDNN
jgi:uncharacterized protein with PQ loop repeat